VKRLCKVFSALGFFLVLSANTLFAQPYSIDEFGNGTRTVFFPNPPRPGPLPVQVASDPTGGITSSPVLIYTLEANVAAGDVALMAPDGTTIVDLLRFFTPAGGQSSEVIFYSRIGGGAPADVGIPSTVNPARINAVSPQTVWSPGRNQPGSVFAAPVFEDFTYTIFITDVPEPSAAALLLVSAGVWAYARKQKGHS
jgi:hypothetical protein